jgi:hypothetical protein
MALRHTLRNRATIDGAQDAEGGVLTCDGLNDTASSAVLLSDGGGIILNGDVLTGAEGAGMLPLVALCACGGGRNDSADGFNCNCVCAECAASGATMGPVRERGQRFRTDDSTVGYNGPHLLFEGL